MTRLVQGFDHAIANQFLIPTGMLYGADISVYHLFFKALLPATLGNIVGGGIFVGAVYWYVFDSMTSGIQLVARISQWRQKQHPLISFHRHHRADKRNCDSGDEEGGAVQSNNNAFSLPNTPVTTRRRAAARDPDDSV